VHFIDEEDHLALRLDAFIEPGQAVPVVRTVAEIFRDQQGLRESRDRARGHIANGAIVEKSDALARAGRIVVGLQSALDFQRGGELAENLNDLYAYVTRRLFHINAQNDVVALEEVRGLVQDVASAWQKLPSLLTPVNFEAAPLRH